MLVAAERRKNGEVPYRNEGTNARGPTCIIIIVIKNVFLEWNPFIIQVYFVHLDSTSKIPLDLHI
jgi:hypothetical protein